MRDAGLMRFGEPFGDLRADVDGLPNRHWACFQQIAHCCAFDQLHRDVVNGTVASKLMDGDDVRVIQP